MVTRTERELTGPFWAAVEHRSLVRPVCADCGRSHFSPQLVCPWCQSSDWSYQPSTGRGVVYSHTTIHRPPEPAFTAPYTVIDVELDEGWRMLSWLAHCEPGDVAIGMPVRVVFLAGAHGHLLPMFEPVDERRRLGPSRVPGGRNPDGDGER